MCGFDRVVLDSGQIGIHGFLGRSVADRGPSAVRRFATAGPIWEAPKRAGSDERKKRLDADRMVKTSVVRGRGGEYGTSKSNECAQAKARERKG
jgi:hypothetical protein